MTRVIANDPTRGDIKAIGVAVRTGNHGGTIHAAGYVQCRHCGGNVGSIARIATAIGVSSSTLSKWLKRETIRQDLATLVRSAFARIEE